MLRKRVIATLLVVAVALSISLHAQAASPKSAGAGASAAVKVIKTNAAAKKAISKPETASSGGRGG